jgi:hypothetical protein
MDSGDFCGTVEESGTMSAKVKKAALELAQELKTNDTRDKEPELKRAKTDDTDGLDDEP